MSAEQTVKPILEFNDTPEAVADWFLEQDLTDGLPIVLPTEERVQAFTDYTEKALGWRADDTIAVIAPKRGVATVRKIAANAVMAGCRPEYMPVLITCVQVVADTRFNLDALQTSKIGRAHV